MTLLRPLARLLAAGAVLSAVSAPWRAAHDAARKAVASGPDTALLAERAFAGGARTALGARAALDEEALYREALAVVATDRDPVVRTRLEALARELELGADAHAGDAVDVAGALGAARRDAVVRRYLIELSRLALGGAAGDAPPTERALADFHATHAERFTTPARVRLSHVYLSAARRGAALEEDARRLLDDVRARRLAPAAAVRLGDPFVRGAHVTGSHDELARVLGNDAAAAADDAPLGTWVGPVRSPYGLHLLHVEARTATAVAPLDTVRGRVAHALLRERREARRRARMDLLRTRYGVGGGSAATSD